MSTDDDGTSSESALPHERGFWFHAGVAVRYLYTIVLAVLTLSLVIVTLAAYQFQNRIAEAEIATTKGGTAPKKELASELRLLQADYHKFKRYTDNRWMAFLDAEQKLADEMRPAFYAQIRAERRIRVPWLAPLDEPTIAGDHRGEVQPASMTGHPALPATDKVPIDPVPGGANDPAWVSALESHREYLNYEARLHELQPDKEANPDLFAIYQDMVYFDHLRYVTFGLIEPMTLAVMPPWMLTLIVTLAMGALGSLLYVTKSFLGDRMGEAAGHARMYLPLSWFLLRPLLGVITAFAVFVFLQAGLALTDGTLTEGGSSLNPFFVAFIATLSGLMSWQAIERIERWGRRFLGEESIQRWAYGLKGAFAMKPDRTVAGLAAALSVTEDQIQRWMDEHQRVPQDIQDKVTAWFGIDRRHLFSDQPSS